MLGAVLGCVMESIIVSISEEKAKEAEASGDFMVHTLGSFGMLNWRNH